METFCDGWGNLLQPVKSSICSITEVKETEDQLKPIPSHGLVEIGRSYHLILRPVTLQLRLATESSQEQEAEEDSQVLQLIF